jgi:hypothetical protein
MATDMNISFDAVGWLSLASLVIFVGSALALPWLLTRLPVDYFVTSGRNARAKWPRNRVAYWTWRFAKNVLGAVLLVAGVVMLVTPGQGILTMLAALWLMDFPGKRQWEMRLIVRPHVLASINWIREKAGRSPMQRPDDHEENRR